MSIRSITGCDRCKNMRRKCDEKKPECSRCIRRGIECRYDYLESRGQGFKTRTVPGRRPKKKLTQIEQPLVGSTSATLRSTSGSPSYNTLDLELLELPPLPLTDVPLLLNTSPYVIGTTPFVQPASAGLLVRPNILFHNPSQRRSALHVEEDDSEQSDVECVKPIIYATPHLNDVVDNSSFKFVLQNYQRWFPRVLFDPLRAMRKVTEKVLYQFSLSATSQSRLVLIAQLLGTLSKEWCLDEQGIIVLGLLRDGIFRDIIGCSPEYPVSGKAIQQANSALNNVLELVVIQVWTAPLSWTISLFRIASPVFLAACQYPLPPRFFDITLDSSLDLRHFAVVDVILSLVTGRATFCRYHIPWSLELSDRLLERQGNQGTEWIIGIPDQFLLVLAYMSGLRTVALEGTSHGDSVLHVQNNTNHRNVRSRKEGLIDPLLAQKLEGDLRRIRILPGQSKDPALMITRIVVQECWREVVYIYFYMALCGAHAEDPRVQHSLKKYMRLVNGIRPGRNPDVFLFTPMVIAGVSAIKAKHRHILTSRTLGLPEHSKPGTTGNDLVKILENVWNRTAMEGRSACWDDLSIACHAVTGM